MNTPPLFCTSHPRPHPMSPCGLCGARYCPECAGKCCDDCREVIGEFSTPRIRALAAKARTARAVSAEEQQLQATVWALGRVFSH